MGQAFIEIEGRRIGPGYKPVVIAEIGINHGGSLTVAKQMVDAAFEAGVEIVKHQTHIIEDEMSSHAKNIKPGNAEISIYDIMKDAALGEDDEIELCEYVRKKGMIFISTPFSRAAAERLIKMNVPAFKIGSGECNNYPLIRHIASFGKPVILSTGMNDLASIRRSVEIFEEYNVSYALLHCTNIYPTPYHLIRLEAITQLADNFPNAVVGLSDHSMSNYPCLGAVALGASIIERHFTDHMDREGPDIICSMDKNACKELIEGANIIFQARKGLKGALDEELVTIKFAFASTVSIADIKRGENFSYENIWVKRPGTGEIAASEFAGLIGKRARIDIKRDVQLKWDMIDG